MAIYDKLLQVQKSVHSVTKQGYNSFSKYEYATYADVLDAVREKLEELGLVLTVTVSPLENTFTFTDDGKYYTVSSCVATATLTDTEDQSFIEITAPGMSMSKQDDKACFKAVTGAKKYAVLGLFNLDTDGADPESDAITVEKDDTRGARTKPPASVPRTSRPARSNDEF